MFDIEILGILQDVGKDLLTTVIVAGAGFASKAAYDQFKIRWRLRHMRNIFGDIHDLEGQMLMVLPVFHPLSESNFSEGEQSRLKKQVVANDRGTRLDVISVPLFSDVLVIDDFKAYRQVERLFVDYRYGFIDFCTDVNALSEWKRGLIVCFGGPRSNQKLRQVMNLPQCDFIDVDDMGDLLTDWVLRYKAGGETGEFRATEEDAYSYIFKSDNPNNEGGKLMGVAGDSAVSTFMAASYLRDNVEAISAQFEDRNFILILHADRSNFDTLKQVKGLVIQ